MSYILGSLRCLCDYLFSLVFVWQFTNGQAYLQFNPCIDGYQYNIFLYNHNLECGHFEPLLLHSTEDIVAQLDKEIGSCICPYQFLLGHFDILSIEKILFEQGFLIYGQNLNDCHDSLLESILTLAPWFDMSNMRKIIAQYFYNYFICNDIRATN